MENKLMRNKLTPYQHLIDIVELYLEEESISWAVWDNARNRSIDNIKMLCTIDKDDNSIEDDGLTGAEVKLQSVRKCGNCVHYQPTIEDDVDAMHEECKLDYTLRPECNFTVCVNHKFGIRRD